MKQPDFSKVDKNNKYRLNVMESPVGIIGLVEFNDKLTHLLWQQEIPLWIHRGWAVQLKRASGVLKEAKDQLNSYFQAELKKFDLPLQPQGTEFQKLAWSSLRKIPYGQVISYQSQAEAMGDKNKVRAVASANGKNPIPIITPCHRVIGKDRRLHGYTGGLERKANLLQIEGLISSSAGKSAQVARNLEINL